MVIPTFNERDNIARIVDAVLIARCHPDVLVVDDGSPDGTADIVRRLGEQHRGRVHLLSRPGKGGLGPAYIAGFRWTQERPYSSIVQMDADGSHSAATLDTLVDELERSDLVIGSRYCPQGRIVGWKLHRRLISSCGNLYARTVLRASVRDLTGGYKAWTRQALLALDFDAVKVKGYGFQIEMTTLAAMRGARIAEVPIEFCDREYGQSKMSLAVALEALTVVWQLRRRIAHEQQRGPVGVIANN